MSADDRSADHGQHAHGRGDLDKASTTRRTAGTPPAHAAESPLAGRPPAEHAGSLATLPVDDPLSTLPETAVRVLEAAQRVVAERGFQSLTLNTVAAEAGENKAMTAYYFGNKAGLVAALVDAIIHDECLSAASRMRNVAEEERLPQLVRELRGMSSTIHSSRVYFDILPHALRNAELRERLAALYRWYFDLKLDWLGIDRADTQRRRRLRGLAQVMSALIDGLALQSLIDPEEFALQPAYDVVQHLFELALPRMLDDYAETPAASREEQP
jgi:AcrR family transcriptional regulator